MSAPAFPSLSSQLKLGIPKGSLEEATISLFDRAGWKIHKHVRNYFPDINDPEITARLCRVQEIPGYIRDGVLDLALTGIFAAGNLCGHFQLSVAGADGRKLWRGHDGCDEFHDLFHRVFHRTVFWIRLHPVWDRRDP